MWAVGCGRAGSGREGLGAVAAVPLGCGANRGARASVLFAGPSGEVDGARGEVR